MVGEGFGFGDGETLGVPVDREGVGLEDVAGEVGDGEAEIRGDGYAECGGAEAGGLRCDGAGGGAAGGKDSPGGVFRRMVVGVEADAENVGAEGVYAEG